MKQTMLIVLLLAVVLVVFSSGCTTQEDKTPVDTTDDQTGDTQNTTGNQTPGTDDNDATGDDTNQTPPDETPDFGIALSTVSMHDSQGDCWLAINGKVYDVSEYTTHPGGVAILEGCGMDATELFETRPMGSGTPHSDDARSYMDNYYIGELA